mgnify:CR=1 FL=1
MAVKKRTARQIMEDYDRQMIPFSPMGQEMPQPQPRRPPWMGPPPGELMGPPSEMFGPPNDYQDPRLANVNLYPPGQRTEPFPEDSPMNLPEFWNTSRDWNKYPMTGDIPGGVRGGGVTQYGPGLTSPGRALGAGRNMSQMSPQQVAQIMKQQEMMEQFKRMITARRHAAMNP